MAIPKALVFILFACLNLVSNNEVKASQLYRTGYHFQPPKNWINDPNGPMYYNGIYHLFYQYNPKGALWGNIAWGHSISKDLINWVPLDLAIVPSRPFDINGCWTGSVTVLPGKKPIILYTGCDSQKRQVQNIAYPKNLSDPLLREWVKPDHNPIIVPTKAKGINESQFRDPTTAWWSNGHWKILIGNERGTKGMGLLYRSRDFKTWTKAQHPLHSAPKSLMWECPDFFPVLLKGREGLETSIVGGHVKHVLKMSLGTTRSDSYMVGHYFPEKDRFIPDNTSPSDSTWLRYDYGNFYASKSFFDEGKNRRILWGWSNESDTPAQDVAKGWSGIQTIPRSLWLDENGKQLLQWPVKELETLRGNGVRFIDYQLYKRGLLEISGITAEQADIDVTFYLPRLQNLEMFNSSWVDPQQLCRQKDTSVQAEIGPFGLLTLASYNLEEYTAVFFRVFKARNKHVVLMCSGGARSSLREEVYKPSFGGFVDVDLDNRKLSLRSLIDHSVVESFGAGGKTCITSRVYPSLALGDKARLYVFNNGTETVKVELSAWSMNKPIMN